MMLCTPFKTGARLGPKQTITQNIPILEPDFPLDWGFLSRPCFSLKPPSAWKLQNFVMESFAMEVWPER